MSDKHKTLQVLVCQHGARRRYAIPNMLEEAEMLAAIYTDSSSASLMGQLSTILGCVSPLSVQRLADRKIDRIPSYKIFSSDKPNLLELYQRLTGGLPKGLELDHQHHQVLSKKMITWGLHDANVIYSMYRESQDFIRWAKSKGAKSVIDVYISPEAGEIMDQESLKFPDWNIGNRLSDGQSKKQLWKEAAELADLLICPSEFVAEGVRSVSPEAAHKIRIVPYGCSINYQYRVNTPKKGRVFFAGGDPLRKGLHYLAEAATVIKEKSNDIDVRVAGELPKHITQHHSCRNLLFLGKLTSEQMKEEYLAADVFVLPSLAEGFAGVVAEAIGAGCPVIVTKEAGSPVVHEREGLLIDARCSKSIVDAILRFYFDREFRENCASECLKQQDFYKEESWRKRLITAIKEVLVNK